MNLKLAITFALISCICAWIYMRSWRKIKYIKCEFLFSNAEKNFLKSLDQAVETRVRIFGKVRIADAISIADNKDKNKKRWQVAFNKVAMKHFDYVICDRRDLKILAVIELDDNSHNSKDRKSRDTFLNDLCNSVGLPLVRVKAARYYDTSQLANEILSVCNIDAENKISSAPSSGRRTIKQNVQQCEPKTKNCSRCNSPMVLRTHEGGADTSFWDCSSFPRCSR